VNTTNLRVNLVPENVSDSQKIAGKQVISENLGRMEKNVFLNTGHMRRNLAV
jgi:hypothetical protein